MYSWPVKQHTVVTGSNLPALARMQRHDRFPDEARSLVPRSDALMLREAFCLTWS